MWTTISRKQTDMTDRITSPFGAVDIDRLWVLSEETTGVRL